MKKWNRRAGVYIALLLILAYAGRMIYMDSADASEERLPLLQNLPESVEKEADAGVTAAPDGNGQTDANVTAAPDGNGQTDTGVTAAPNENGQTDAGVTAAPDGNGQTDASVTAAPDGSGTSATADTDKMITLKARYSVMNQKATIRVSVKSKYALKKLVYLKGNVDSVSSSQWKNGKSILKKKCFQTKKKGVYSILAKDEQGNKKIVKVSVIMEMKAVWLYYQEMSKKAKSFAKWKKYIDQTFDTCLKNKMNAIIFQVRPCADAMYPSNYFPWSKYATGVAGKDPGFDPFGYAVEAAHQRGLAIHAWMNPYRITIHSSKVSSLPENSIARRWAASADAAQRRNVLMVNGALYFNPASSAVQNLVVKGVNELVADYDIDGIHMDDYFYPSLGTKNNKKFDYKEYKLYRKSRKAAGRKWRSLVGWRRENVNKMVRKVYAAVKKADQNCIFGISPAGNLKNLYSSTSYYSPVKTWMKSKKYIDYICPQIYWSFTQKVAPYKRMVKQWTAIKRSSTVNLYIGLAGYRAGITGKEAKAIFDPGWAKSNTILKRQVEYSRNAAKEVKNLQKIIEKR